ncbi:hypothetical protein ACH4D7_37855, partial [Streptomyces sp. NPDC018063]|uniref:hypothetical protein n=1 Tax=unclassified Streptomyces TaxID=2593676 RepID=UPI003798DF1D
MDGVGAGFLLAAAARMIPEGWGESHDAIRRAYARLSERERDLNTQSQAQIISNLLLHGEHATGLLRGGATRLTDADYEEMLKVWFEGDGDLQVPHNRLPRPGETVEITLGAGTSHPVRRPVNIGSYIKNLRDKSQGRARLTEESKRLLRNHGTLDEADGKWFFEPTVERLITDEQLEEALRVWFEGEGDLQVPHDRLPREKETVEITVGAGTSQPVRRSVKIGTHIRTLIDNGRARLTEESKRLLRNHGTLIEADERCFFEPTVTRLIPDGQFEEMLKVWFEGDGDLQVPHNRLPRKEETVEITVGADTSHPVRRSVNIGAHIKTLRDKSHGRARLTEESKRLLRNHGTLNEADGKWFFEPTLTRLTDAELEEALRVWFEGEGDLQVPHDRLPRPGETVEITVGAGEAAGEGTSQPARLSVNVGVMIASLKSMELGRASLTAEAQRLLRLHGTLDRVNDKWVFTPEAGGG